MSDLGKPFTTDSEVAKQYICWLCGTEFAQKVDLDLHSSTNCSHTPITTHIVDHYSAALPSHISDTKDHLQICLDESTSCASNLIEQNYDHFIVVKKHSCPFCLRGYTRKDHLRRHLNTSCQSAHNITNTNVGEKKYSCELCDKLFTRKDHLQRHITTVCGSADIVKPSFICSLCGSEFLIKDRLIRHLYSTNKHITNAQKLFTCVVCNFKCLRKDKIQAHLKRHYINQQKRHRCMSCHIQFPSNEELSYHLSNGNSSSKKKIINFCCICKTTFSTKPELTKHLNVGDEEKKIYICFLCGTLCMLKDDLEAHMLYKHIKQEIDIFKPTLLDVIEIENADHKVGAVEHCSKEEPFVCDICNYVLLDNPSFILHMENHRTENIIVNVKLEVEDC